MLPITLRALSYQRTRYLPGNMRLLFGRSTVGTSPRHGPSRRVDTGPTSIRRMSSSPSKHLFLVYAPDYVRPGMLDHRLSVREKHLQGVDGLLERGFVKFGGAFLAPELMDESGRKKMMGSVMFFEAESIEDVRKVVEADPYFTDGVWDKEKLIIYPFVPAMHWPSK